MNAFNFPKFVFLLIDSFGKSLINTHFIFEGTEILISFVLKRLPPLFLSVKLLCNSNKLRIKSWTLRRRIQLTRHNKINYRPNNHKRVTKNHRFMWTKIYDLKIWYLIKKFINFIISNMNLIIYISIALLLVASQADVDKGIQRLNTMRNKSISSPNRIITFGSKNFTYLIINIANTSWNIQDLTMLSFIFLQIKYLYPSIKSNI